MAKTKGKAKRKPARKARAKAKPRARKASARKRPAKRKAPVRKPAGKRAAKPAPAARPGKRKAAKEPPEPVLPWRQALPGETLVGVVDDFFSHVNAIAFTLRQPLAVGDRIHVRGHTTDLLQNVESMQIDHKSIDHGVPGDSVGIQVHAKCRAGDYVYRLST